MGKMVSIVTVPNSFNIYIIVPAQISNISGINDPTVSKLVPK